MPDRVKHMSDLFFILSSGLFAAIGGSINYVLKVIEGHRFSWAEFLVHTLISAFFGFVAYEFFAFEGIPPQFSAALSGMTGYYGTRISRIVEVVVLKKKLGLDPKEVADLEPCKGNCGACKEKHHEKAD